MTYNDFIKTYWQYYLSLEDKFLDTINYVEISESNFNTYSNTYTMLLQTIGSEMNVVFKELCCFDKSDKKSVKDFSNKILSHYPEIRNQEIEAMGYGITFKPFESWNLDRPGESLVWWKAYNNNEVA